MGQQHIKEYTKKGTTATFITKESNVKSTIDYITYTQGLGNKVTEVKTLLGAETSTQNRLVTN